MPSTTIAQICSGRKRSFVADDANELSARVQKSTDLDDRGQKDAEAYHNARLAPGRHDYGGWYHFVGQLTVDGDFAAVTSGRALRPVRDRTQRNEICPSDRE